MAFDDVKIGEYEAKIGYIAKPLRSLTSVQLILHSSDRVPQARQDSGGTGSADVHWGPCCS